MKMKTITTALCCIALMSINGYTQQTTDSGVSNDDFEGVVGGEIVQPGQFPWMTSLAMSNGDPGCGASLIHPQWVLTAGHCVIQFFPGMPTVEQVIINSVIIDVNALEPFSELIDVDTIISHPDYNFGQGPDVALIRLIQPATTTPVLLAEVADSNDYAGNMPAKVLGWGKTVAGGDGVDSLLTANCIFISDDTCATLYSASGQQSAYNANPGGNICAGFFSGDIPAGAAQGDSGGPLFYEDTNGDYKQVGVVSGGNSDVTTEDFPGVFTLVPKYKEWIETTIADYEELFLSIENEEQTEITFNINQMIEISGLSANANYNISVVDVTGKLVTGQLANLNGMTQYQIDISNQASGLYIVNVVNKDSGKLITKKFIHNN